MHMNYDDHSKVSVGFLKELRKQFVSRENGSPLPGFEDIAEGLIEVRRLMQFGHYADAIEAGDQLGFKLAPMYATYVRWHDAHRVLGSNWHRVVEACEKFGGRVRFPNWEVEAKPLKQPGTVSKPKLEKYELDVPKWRRTAK